MLRPLLEADVIARRITELAVEIRRTYGDQPIVVCGVLKGGVPFMADLIRHLSGAVEIEFLGVSSYAGTETTGAVRITHDLKRDIAGQDVLLVEDIVDTGLTLDWLRRTLGARGPRSLRIATLLDKPERRRVEVVVDFVGFTIPDRFVVGFGLDLNERYRNLPYIAEVVEGP